jgi:hypothetical protein
LSVGLSAAGFFHAIPVIVLVAGLIEFVWRAVLARRAWIRYVRLYRAKVDPDYTNPAVPPIGWPLEPGWRENTPRHPKTYSKKLAV